MGRVLWTHVGCLYVACGGVNVSQALQVAAQVCKMTLSTGKMMICHLTALVLCCAALWCTVPQSLNKPVTDLMTRSTPTEVAAFANDPHYSTNNTAYKHMISQWR